jgi:hypothetical protein
MAVIAQKAGARETVRQKREREQELLVWPDLVFVEFICAVLFTIAFVALSVLFNAPLLNKANPAITPDPSKAPWYFMNLQELLLHMDKGLAGVVVPTMLLVVLAAVPYIDRSNDGQGGWFATPNAIRITVFSFIYTGFWLTFTILWDDGAHVRIWEQLGWRWPGNHCAGGSTDNCYGEFKWLNFPGGDLIRVIWDFIFLPNRVAIREKFEFSLPVPFQPGSGTDGHLDWPADFREVPLPLNGTWIWNWSDPADTWMPGWLRRVYPYNTQLDIPAITAEYIMPIAMMVGLPILLIVILRKIGWAHTVRDAMIALFTGFIVVYLGLTIIGVAFRGESQELVPPTRVPNLEGDPSIYRYVPPPEQQLTIVDTRTGARFHG